jgi:hypothetical protein
MFAFPHAGFYESTMGGAGAFWCNAPPLKNTAGCARRFVLMGFSYERGVGEMLGAFGHRVESIMTRVFEHTTGEANLWERFCRYDQKAPGKAEVGTIHFAPNSERDYDWANPREVPSFCDSWYKFPELDTPLRAARKVSAAEWGGGDIRGHHLWWLTHLPRVAGRKNGVHNNWWQYAIAVNLGQIKTAPLDGAVFLFDRAGSTHNADFSQIWYRLRSRLAPSEANVSRMRKPACAAN